MHVGRKDVGRLFGSHFQVASFADIQEAARLLGMELQGRRMSVETLQSGRPLGVLHLDGSHFVAVVGYEQYGPRIVDPIDVNSSREAVWPYVYLRERWDGRILVLTGVKAQHAGTDNPTGPPSR
jgi:ABC-type bacteriocin/lantibiotic exporter with double-glycine peptidase domain